MPPIVYAAGAMLWAWLPTTRHNRWMAASAVRAPRSRSGLYSASSGPRQSDRSDGGQHLQRIGRRIPPVTGVPVPGMSCGSGPSRSSDTPHPPFRLNDGARLVKACRKTALGHLGHVHDARPAGKARQPRAARSCALNHHHLLGLHLAAPAVQPAIPSLPWPSRRPAAAIRAARGCRNWRGVGIRWASIHMSPGLRAQPLGAGAPGTHGTGMVPPAPAVDAPWTGACSTWAASAAEKASITASRSAACQGMAVTLPPGYGTPGLAQGLHDAAIAQCRNAPLQPLSLAPSPTSAPIRCKVLGGSCRLTQWARTAAAQDKTICPCRYGGRLRSRHCTTGPYRCNRV